MAPEGNNGQEKPIAAAGYGSLGSVASSRRRDLMVVLLRVVALLATLSATIVMATNKQTKTIVVATVGTTTIKATLTAKFQNTPANVFFVVANGWATLHNILMLALEICKPKMDFKGFRYTTISVLDMMMLALLSAGTSSAAYMAELAKKGNSHAQWNKICDKFETFCSHGGAAIIVSFVGLVLLLVISVMSNLKLRRQEPPNSIEAI
ncbi:hypothetical protein Ancab_019131 [Ancistrocladus abbreviatus]